MRTASVKKARRKLKRFAALTRCLLRAGQWLCVENTAHLSRKELRRITREHFAHLPRKANRNEFPRASRVMIRGHPYYLRPYWLRHLRKPVICIWASHTASRLGLLAPRVCQRCFAKVGGHLCFVILEKELQGATIKGWTPELAADLARGIAAWHSVPSRRYNTIEALCRHALPQYSDLLRSLEGLRLTEPQSSAVQGALACLRDESFRGEIALSHGDLHYGNLLAVGQNRIGWLDLDSISVQPLRHDLAAAELGLLLGAPEMVEAFEDAYFRERPDQKAGWKEYRLRWFALYSLLQGAKYQLERTFRPGFKSRTKEERDRRARAHFTRALACLHTEDKGQSTARLIEDILRNEAATPL